MSDQPRVEIYTKEDCPYCDKAKDLFDSKGVEYEEYNMTGDEELFEEMVERAGGRKTAPEVFVDDELIGGWDDTSKLDETGELDEKLGLVTDGGDEIVEHRPLVIAGTGIAGLTAAVYAGRANNDPLVIEGDEPGGQLTLTTDVANYPGFPEGIGGPELVNKMKEQARQFGADLQNGVIESVDDSTRPFRVELTNGNVYTADAVIAASGASARTLGVPGEDELMGYGLSTCATCDGAFFRGEDMLVVGGGDAAMEEATFLTKFADTVYIAHRREEFRAEDYWVDRVHEKVEDGEIEIMKNTELLEVHGSQEEGVDYVTLVENDKGHPTDRLEDPETNEFEFDVGAVFLAIGHTPNTEYLEDTGVEMDDDGYLVTQGGDGGGQTETAVPGIFGAGDVVDYHYQQAVTAAGMGSKAALDADEYLEDVERAESGEAEAAAADD
ncbi:glutaredoxin 3 [Natronobacterium gregoryi]|uniref:Glutaredoxin 3 n=2 Tax=Natronobacterium gregoryi TaxID=44930 RepID=L0AMV8_NATGS|nr:glutaredoxin 3 [Natronobacterium gregoryi]AFZ74804.1 Glutaredoxin, GrxC family [Natronobacterium gregoryi SP2]ELY66136.1 thioredoxin reductase [Natronobacterium gregoryi SP2]PLK19489.1 glutaredoxin 3 [Natronobacterium gregoryi SP2]SFJ43440.1 thioredoxin reductase (NADPH) [Natronobacterium gregoryi]